MLRINHKWAGLVLLMTLLTVQAATAANVSEMLEKAIYTEETVGDLDKAIQAYEQILAEGKKSRRAVAEAQFRIGVCYAKLGKTTRANAAFQAVIDDYPQVKELVTKAKGRLPGAPELLPVPWGDGDEMIYEMKLPTGMDIGHQVFRIGKREKDGRPYWECTAWQTVTIRGMAGKSRVSVDYESFAPMTSEWKHTMLGHSKANYGKDTVSIDMKGKDEPITIDFDGIAYDNEQCAQMFRRLPLKVGFKTKVTVVPILTGVKLDLTLSVPKRETIKVPAGEFECFRLFLDDLKQTFWVSNDEHRYIVRFQAGGVTADLTEVRPFKLHETKEYEGERFSITLPPNWYAYSPSKRQGTDATHTALIDPEANTRSRVKSAPIETFNKEHDTPQAWLEWGLSDNADHMKDYALSEEGVQAIEIDGRDAAQAVYDHVGGDKTVTTWRINTYGESSAVDIRFTAEKDSFDAWKPAFEEIVNSLRVK